MVLKIDLNYVIKTHNSENKNVQNFEVADEWTLEVSVRSKKVRIDGVVRVSKKFYKRNYKYRVYRNRGYGDFILRVLKKSATTTLLPIRKAVR